MTSTETNNKETFTVKVELKNGTTATLELTEEKLLKLFETILKNTTATD